MFARNVFTLRPGATATLILAAASIAWGQAPAQDAPRNPRPNVQAQNPSVGADQSTIPMNEQPPSTAPNQTQSTQAAKLPESDAAPGTDLPGSIQAALQQEPSLKDSSISVRQDDSGIELTGTVPSRQEKKLADRIARARAGGRSVKNHIKVTGPLHK